MKQQIRFCKSFDGTQIAYAITGQGPPLVKAPHWLTHLEYEFQSPLWRPWIEALSKDHALLRMDARPCGLCDWEVADISFEAWVRDFEAVVDAAEIERFALLGHSQGAPIAVEYAARHPERVSHIVILGGYARGSMKRGLPPERIAELEAQLKLVEAGWGRDDASYRQMFAMQFVPGATLEQLNSLSELQRAASSPQNTVRIMRAWFAFDVQRSATRVRCPTLLLHARGDRRVPFEEGRILAGLIPGARLVLLETDNHILLAHEPAFRQFFEELRAFVPRLAAADEVEARDDVAEESKLPRRLAAILSADVKGYSRLMEEDEEATVRTMTALRKDAFALITGHTGRVVDSPGDNVLGEFPSAVEAVRCAVKLQQSLKSRNERIAESRRMQLRIGIHLGDVIVDGERIYGDGVNIAARLEGLAEAGGVLISESVRLAAGSRLPFAYEFAGEHSLKNIAEPVRAYRLRVEEVSASDAASPPALPQPELTLPDKPSIAVLPFANMSGDPEQEYFTDGVTEDIITELSRFHSLFVIARNSTFIYKGKSVDVREVAKELGVRYVLEGSIRKSANRVRVSGQLIDALTGNHLWAERYDRVLEDIFEVQEEVTRNIVAAIAPQIDAAELAAVSRRRPANLSAYEIALRAWANARDAMNRQDRTLRDQAIREAKEALSIDPKSVLAHNAIAYAQWQNFYLRTAPDTEAAWRAGMDAAMQSIELDPSDHRAYMHKGRLLAFKGGHWDEALNYCRRACELNPNDSFALYALGGTESACGDAERGIQHLHQALRANPRNPWAFNAHASLAVASFIAKDYSKGVEWALLALGSAPKLLAALQHLATCYVGLGEIEKARAAFERLRGVAPEFVESRLKGESMLRRPEDRERQAVFMRIAAGLDAPSAADALR